MYLIWLVFSGVVMGLIAAVPVGPVNLICIRRTFAFGPMNGFVSGIGAALGDGVFAAVTGFGLTWVAQLIKGYAAIIELVGGVMLLYFGVHAFLNAAVSKLDDASGENAPSSLLRALLSTFALTITNPATLLAFTSMFAALGGLAGGPGSFVDAAFVVAGVVGGSAAWWLILTTVIGLFHARLDAGVLVGVNRFSGVLVAGCGVVVLFLLIRHLLGG